MKKLRRTTSHFLVVPLMTSLPQGQVRVVAVADKNVSEHDRAIYFGTVYIGRWQCEIFLSKVTSFHQNRHICCLHGSFNQMATHRGGYR